MTSAVELEMKRQHISVYGLQFLEHSVVAAGSGGSGRWGRGIPQALLRWLRPPASLALLLALSAGPEAVRGPEGCLGRRRCTPPPPRPAAHRHLVSRLLDRWRPGGGPGGQGWAAATCHQIPAGQRLEALTLEGKGLSPDSFSPPF